MDAFTDTRLIFPSVVVVSIVRLVTIVQFEKAGHEDFTC